MRILHYIANLTSAAGPQATNTRIMILSTSMVAEVHIVTSVSLTEEYVKTLSEQYGVKVHYLKVHNINPLNILETHAAITKTINEIRPDVVHVHGSWDYRAALVERSARKKHIVTLVSPHNGMAQELIGIDFWKKKLPRLIAYQTWMIRNCTAVIATSDKERNDIQTMFMKRRIEVVPPIPKTDESVLPLQTALMKYYRKAQDTTYYTDLTEKEKKLVHTALRSVTADDDTTTEAPDINGVSFRRVFFYAYDEDIMEKFIEGCKKLNVNIPTPLNVENVERYRNPKAKQRGSLTECKTKVRVIRLPEEKTVERSVISMIAKAKSMTINRLTLRHYTELYNMFRHSDFDEDIVSAELKRLHLRAFTIKLQKRLESIFALKAGYEIF